MTEVLNIPAHEAHVVRVFAVSEGDGAPLADHAVLDALGAEGDLRTDAIEVVEIADLGDMPLSAYLGEGYGIAEAELSQMRGQLDGLTGRVLILPSRAFQGAAMTLRVGGPLRLVGRLTEDVAPVHFDALPDGGAQGSGTGEPADPGSTPNRMRNAALVLVALLIGVTVLVVVLAGS